jgi:hypothetical protein
MCQEMMGDEASGYLRVGWEGGGCLYNQAFIAQMKLTDFSSACPTFPFASL